MNSWQFMQDASSSTVCFYDSMMPYTFHHCSCRGFAKFQEPPESSHQRIRSKPSRCIIISYYIHHHVYHHVLSCDIMSGGQDDLDVDGCGWMWCGISMYLLCLQMDLLWLHFLHHGVPGEQHWQFGQPTLSPTSTRLVQNCFRLFQLFWIILKDGSWIKICQNYEPPEWMVSLVSWCFMLNICENSV